MKVKETIEREKRRNNIVLMGLKEGDEESDKTEVNKIVEALIPDIKIPFELLGRIGRKSEKIRPIRVKLTDVNDRKRLLVRAKNLKKEGFDKIFLVPDLTRNQQEEDKNQGMNSKA